MDNINVNIPEDFLKHFNNLVEDTVYELCSLSGTNITLDEARATEYTLNSIIEDSSDPRLSTIQGLTEEMVQTAQELLPKITTLIEPALKEHEANIARLVADIMLPIQAMMLANPITLAALPELPAQASEEALKRTENAIQSIIKSSPKSR